MYKIVRQILTTLSYYIICISHYLRTMLHQKFETYFNKDNIINEKISTSF